MLRQYYLRLMSHLLRRTLGSETVSHSHRLKYGLSICLRHQAKSISVFIREGATDSLCIFNKPLLNPECISHTANTSTAKNARWSHSPDSNIITHGWPRWRIRRKGSLRRKATRTGSTSKSSPYPSCQPAGSRTTLARSPRLKSSRLRQRC